MEKYKFAKMQAFGNDFAIFDFRQKKVDKPFSEAQIIVMSDRNFGIGCDQLITLHESSRPGDEKGDNVAIRVFNKDGSEAKNCGNGIRCVIGYVARETQKPLVRVQIGNKMMIGKPDRKSLFAKVNMGVPILNNDIVELGNEHKVIVVDDFNSMKFEPDQQYNLHYVKLKDRGEVFMRTIERGSGETLSCGSGTCAVAAYCIANNLVDKNVKVVSRGSDIMDTYAEVSWDGPGKAVLLGGKYAFVFSGEIDI